MHMKKFLAIVFISAITTQCVLAFGIKVYDEMGNRIGTYKKEGDNYVLYDFNDKKIDNPEDLMKDPPSQNALKEYNQLFYDENMIPIGGYYTGLWMNSGRHCPGRRFVPRCFYRTGSPYVVRPKAGSTVYEERYPYGRVKSKIK